MLPAPKPWSNRVWDVYERYLQVPFTRFTAAIAAN